MGNICEIVDRQGIDLKPVETHPKQAQSQVNDSVIVKSETNPKNIHTQHELKVNLSHNNKNKTKHQSQTNTSDYKGTILKLYQKCKVSYQQHYIDSAAQYAQQISNLLGQAHEKKIDYDLNPLQKKLLQRVRLEYQDVVFYENQIEKEGWELKSDKNEIKISCRRQPEGTVGCRIQAFSDVPFQIFISVMIQMDYYKDYTPFLQISRQEKQVSRNCRIGYTLSQIPFFTKRQSFFQGVGYSRLDHESKQLFLFTRSIHDKKHLQQLLQFPVQINQDYIQLDYKYFVIRYRPIKKNFGLIDIGMNVDVKIDFIPTWLMEKISKDFGQKFFKNIIRISKNFKGSKWQKNVENNPHLFLYFQKEVKDYFQKQKLE